jgi:hypothetical protein
MTGALRRRRGRVAAIAVLLAGAVLSAAAAPGHRPALRALSTPAPPRAPAAPVAAAPSGPEPALVEQPVGLVPPPPFSEHPLRPHEIFGFAPYWSLGMAGGYPLRELTTVAYFGVDVAADGSLQQSGEGWSGYVSPELTALVGRAHAAGAGVVLTAKQFDAGTLHRLVNDPAAAPRLGHALVDAIRARGMDGANLDLEGLDGADRAAFATFAVSVSSALHAVNPRWQVTVDTYTNSAWDTAGYFDVARIAPAVDALFVMAYDMQGDNPSPVAPLRGARLNDAQSVAAYRATVGASKVILGVPFYGVDWPTSGGDRTATATGKPQPVTYAQLADAGHPPGRRRPVAPGVLRGPPVDRHEGRAGRCGAPSRRRHLGAGDGRQRPRHGQGAARPRRAGEAGPRPGADARRRPTACPGCGCAAAQPRGAGGTADGAPAAAPAAAGARADAGAAALAGARPRTARAVRAIIASPPTRG